MATEKTHFVYSTLAADVNYTGYGKDGDGNSYIDHDKSVLIRGGAGIADQHLVTPIGVSTRISGDELELLEANPIFKTHVKNGHIRVIAKPAAVEKVVGDMKTRDDSAPMVPGDFKPDKEPVALTPGAKPARGGNKRQTTA